MRWPYGPSLTPPSGEAVQIYGGDGETALNRTEKHFRAG